MIMNALKESFETIADIIKTSFEEAVRSVANKEPSQVIAHSEPLNRPAQTDFDAQTEFRCMSRHLSRVDLIPGHLVSKVSDLAQQSLGHSHCQDCMIHKAKAQALEQIVESFSAKKESLRYQCVELTEKVKSLQIEIGQLKAQARKAISEKTHLAAMVDQLQTTLSKYEFEPTQRHLDPLQLLPKGFLRPGYHK
jgi:predicted RNase H-like nuclease (RuvC/YqgF family)